MTTDTNTSPTHKRRPGRPKGTAGPRKDGTRIMMLLASDVIELADACRATEDLPSRTAAVEMLVRRGAQGRDRVSGRP